MKYNTHSTQSSGIEIDLALLRAQACSSRGKIPVFVLLIHAAGHDYAN
jgi:hypothetical protein